MANYVQTTRRRASQVAGSIGIVAGLLAAIATRELVYCLLFELVVVTFVFVSRAEVSTSDEGVTIRNPFRTRFVPWDDIEGLTYGRLPSLQLRSGGRVGLEGVEPFPQAFPTKASKDVLAAFADEVERRTAVERRT